MIHLIYGPPAAGKSSLLGRVAEAASAGIIPYKVTVLDLECFDSKKDAETILAKVNYRGCHVIGAGATPPDVKVLQAHVKWLLIPDGSLEGYQARYRDKAATRGVGTDEHHRPAGALRVYHSFMKALTEGRLHRLLPSPEVLIDWLTENQIKQEDAEWAAQAIRTGTLWPDVDDAAEMDYWARAAEEDLREARLEADLDRHVAEEHYLEDDEEDSTD